MPDRKGSKVGNYRPNHAPKKRKFQGNKFTSDRNTEKTSTSAKKLKVGDDSIRINVIPTSIYCIIHWSVFLSLQEILVCKSCKQKIVLYKSNGKVLGLN